MLAALSVESTYIQIKNGFAMIEPWDARAKKNMLSKVAEGGILVMINLQANAIIQPCPSIIRIWRSERLSKLP